LDFIGCNIWICNFYVAHVFIVCSSIHLFDHLFISKMQWFPSHT
jgi:hypothetical protein